MAKEPLTIRDFLVRGMSALLPSPEGKKALFRYDAHSNWEKSGRGWYVDILGAACLMEYKARYKKFPKTASQLEDFYFYGVYPHMPAGVVRALYGAQWDIFNAPDAVQYVYEFTMKEFENELSQRPLAPFKH